MTCCRMLCAAALLLAAPLSSVTAQQPAVTLSPEQVTIPLQSGAAAADGVLDVTVTGLSPAEVTLRATPLRQGDARGDARGFVHFPDNAGHDTIRLDAVKPACQSGKPCAVRYSVTELWPPGLYQGGIEAWGPVDRLANAPISVDRLASSFHPVVSSNMLHDGRIAVDIEGSEETSFLLSVQNPAGSRPYHFFIGQCDDGGGSCPAKTDPSGSGTIGFQPGRFSLEPGATQVVRAVVRPCPTSANCSMAMTIGDADPNSADAALKTVISVNQYRAGWIRQIELFGAVVLGSIISVLLNNLFPATRTKQAIRNDLRRIEETLHACPNAGSALLDGLRAEATRLKLVLHGISFTDSTKEAALQSAREATAALDSEVALAGRLSRVRTDADGAILSIVKHASLRSKLRDAEEALRANDAGSAASHLNEAQAELTQARNDGEQAELRRTLAGSITKLMDERGIRPPLPDGAPANTPPPRVRQPAARSPIVRDLIDQLDQDSRDYAHLDTADLLDAERDFYIADVWTEYMERKAAEFAGAAPAEGAEAWEARRWDWETFGAAFLQCLRRIPNSDHCQNMIDLIRHDTTPQDVAAALRAGHAQIECDPQPKYLEAVDFALTLTDPVLRDVAAVRRLLSYQWSFGDGSTPPPDVDHCRHYFQRPRRELRTGRVPQRTYQVSVKLSVPFTDMQEIVFTRDVTPRASRAGSITRLTGWIGFLITASIAVVTAFGAKYATSVPYVVGWPDLLTAFLLGFGLDQLRDAVNTPLSPAAPPARAAPAAAAAGAGVGGRAGGA